MTLTTEDGTGKLDAEAYHTVTTFRAYCAKFGLSLGTKTDEECEIALRQTGDYMVSLLRGQFQGYRAIYNQALDFPRSGAYRDEFDPIPYNTIPVEVLACEAELAYLRISGQAFANDQTGRTKKRVKIGPLEVDYDGDNDPQPAFINAIRRLNPFFTGRAGKHSVGLVRC